MMKVCGILGVCSVACVTSAAAVEAPVDLCDYRPVLNEDFTHFKVTPRVLGPGFWTAHTPWNGDFGDAAFADPGPDSPFSTHDGVLSITARKDSDGHWRSGLIAAADASGAGYGARYGYFTARMRFPPGPGTWPAFWLTSLKPVSDTSPSVEIDAVEYYGRDDSAFQSALHVWYSGADAAKTRQTTHKTDVEAGALVSGFHDYAIRVAADEITFYFDRRPIWRQSTPPELTAPLYPIVNLALGSGFPTDKTPDPSVLKVESVQVYAYDPEDRKSRCP